VVDVRAPVRTDLTTGRAKDVDFIQADISDVASIGAAFNAPWPDDSQSGTAPQTTVFHTVAIIRFYERSESLLENSAKINITGTQNVINAARDIGATALVYTSTGSVSIHSTRFLLWPWEAAPFNFVQVVSDEASIPKEHYDFFSNYAVTKMAAERQIWAADKTASREGILRTGCLRPGNGIFGPWGDQMFGASGLSFPITA
jgi:nucleoside-diphosphate-sugar epimerase